MKRTKKEPITEVPEGYVRLSEALESGSERYRAFATRLATGYYLEWEKEKGTKASVKLQSGASRGRYIHSEVLDEFQKTYHKNREHFQSEDNREAIYEGLKTPASEAFGHALSELKEYINFLVTKRLNGDEPSPYQDERIAEMIEDAALDIATRKYSSVSSFTTRAHQNANEIAAGVIETPEVAAGVIETPPQVVTIDPRKMSRLIDPRVSRPHEIIDDIGPMLDEALKRFGSAARIDFLAVFMDGKTQAEQAEERGVSPSAVYQHASTVAQRLSRVPGFCKSLREAAAATASVKGCVREVY